MQGHDRDALSMMAVAARAALASDQIEASADKGDDKSEEILACDKADFACDAAANVYVCPPGEQLIYRFTAPQDGKNVGVYWSRNCADVSLFIKCFALSCRAMIKDKCTRTAAFAALARVLRNRPSGTGWDHENVLERAQQRPDKDPTQLAVRRMTVEPPTA